jgi:hypothetical protein
MTHEEKVKTKMTAFELAIKYEANPELLELIKSADVIYRWLISEEIKLPEAHGQ